MFREVSRKNKALAKSECIEILKNEKRGVLSLLGDNGYPYGMPMNHFYNEEDGKLYFHSGKKGHKVDALNACRKASFCVYDKGYRNEGEWALNIKSVIAFGKIEVVEDMDKLIDICRKLCYKFTNDSSYIEKEIEEDAKHTLCFALNIEHLAGKTVKEA